MQLLRRLAAPLLLADRPRTTGSHVVCPSVVVTVWGRQLHGNNENGSPYSSTERRVPALIPVLGSQPAGDVSHKPGSGLP